MQTLSIRSGIVEAGCTRALRIFGADTLPRNPAPSRAFNPSRERDAEAEDAAWWTAFSLTVDGIEADPDRELPAPQRVAFLCGWASGSIQRDADLQAEADELAERARIHAEEVEASGLPYWQAEAIGA